MPDQKTRTMKDIVSCPQCDENVERVVGPTRHKDLTHQLYYRLRILELVLHDHRGDGFCETEWQDFAHGPWAGA